MEASKVETGWCGWFVSIFTRTNQSSIYIEVCGVPPCDYCPVPSAEGWGDGCAYTIRALPIVAIKFENITTISLV